MNIFTPLILLALLTLLGAGGFGLVLAAVLRPWSQRILSLGLTTVSWSGLVWHWHSLSSFTLD